MIRIEIAEGPGRGERREFDQEIVNLGRGASNHFVIENPYISTEHGQIYLSGERVFYADLNSTNGSGIRREGVERFFRDAKEEILPGDVLLLGSKETPVALRYLGADLGEEMETSRTIVASRSVSQARELGDQLDEDSAALSALFRLTRDLSAAKSRAEAAGQIAAGLLSAFPQSRFVAVYEGPAGRLVPSVVRSLEGAAAVPAELAAPVRERLSKAQESMLFEVPGEKSAQGTGTGLLSPLLAQGKLSGALRVEARKGARSFDGRDLDLLTVFAAHASKTLENMDLVERLRESEARLADENRFLKSQASPQTGLVGDSPAMSQLQGQIQKVTPTDTTVLILGETGTGKELVARAIHNGGPRAERLFVALNCGAFPENLLESELFGHVKGSFTGATTDKRGLFDVADGGTIFLDEVGELPLPMQVKLLRVLQEGEFTPVGSTKPKKVNVRVLSATNKDLQKEVKEGRFREDLFYRLNVFPVRVPPLRERRVDVEALARHFLSQVAPRVGRGGIEIAGDALEALRAHAWPGNVRELENEIERAAITAEPGEPIRASDLSERVLAEAAGEGEGGASEGSLHGRLLVREKEIIRETLSQTGGNRTRAAEILGISRQAFMKKIARYGIR